MEDARRIGRMKPLFALAAASLLCSLAQTSAAELVYAKDGSGVYGYKDTPRQPWSGFLVHDPDRPAPRRVDPGSAPAPAPVPADALVLFGGADTDRWQSNTWRVVDGCWETAGALSPRTKDKFGSFQLHVEWMCPANYDGPWYNRGNNGVLLHDLYEIQIFDSFNEKLYPDGQCAAVYAQTPPLVNACRPPGQWQSYDIAFSAPVFDGDTLKQPARVTLFHNGVLAHLNQEIYGGTGHHILSKYSRKVTEGPIVLAGHGCPVRFRNIWIRRL